MVRPTINQMLKAIDLDSKLAGHYSADRRQSTVDNSQLTMDSTEMECNTRKDDNLSLPFSGIGRNPNKTQQKNKALSLGEGWVRPTRKGQKTPRNYNKIQQKNKALSLGEGWVRPTRKGQKTPRNYNKIQQKNKALSPGESCVKLKHPESQQIATTVNLSEYNHAVNHFQNEGTSNYKGMVFCVIIS